MIYKISILPLQELGLQTNCQQEHYGCMGETFQGVLAK